MGPSALESRNGRALALSPVERQHAEEEASTVRLDVCASRDYSLDLEGRQELCLQGTTDLHCAENSTVYITPFICPTLC